MADMDRSGSGFDQSSTLQQSSTEVSDEKIKHGLDENDPEVAMFPTE